VLALCFSFESTSFGQGIVDFENFNNSLIYTNSVHNGPATGLMSGPGGTYRFAILAAEPTTTTIDATLDNGTALDAGGWSFEDDTGTNTATPGLMNGNYTTDPGIDIVGWGPGEAASFAVVGWSTNIGTTYAQAKAWWNNGNPSAGPSGWFGISSVAQDVLVGGSIFPVPTIFGPTAGGEFQGFTLNYYSVSGPIPPVLNIAQSGASVLISWSTNATDYTLQSNTNLNSASWVTNAVVTPVVVGSQFVVTNSPGNSMLFYRLKK
jgi:hypothetical protein